MTQQVGSAFERKFDSLPIGKTLVSTRREAFDFQHGLFYSPLGYEETNAPEIRDELPDECWIYQAFGEFVRVEFGNANPPTPELGEIEAGRRDVDLLDVGLHIRDALERSLVYGGVLEDILDGVRGFDVVEQMYEILCDDAFGRQENRRNVSVALFEEMASNIRVGCRLILPGLPFRDQNAFRTNDKPGEVTLAEALFLIRLHCTALAIYQVLPTGADVLVLSDGRLYADLFGVSTASADEYFSNVRRLRDNLNLRGTVSIIDLERLISLYDRGTGSFSRCIANIERALHAGRDTELAAGFDALERGMRWNYNSRGVGCSLAATEHWLSKGIDLEGELGRLPSARSIAGTAARYAATNLALRWHDLIKRMLPAVLRATMHPKEGQIALPRLGSCFPWNGVAVAKQAPRGLIDVEVHSLAEAHRRRLALIGHRDKSGTTVYYERKDLI
jgi:hypothetical protein